MKRSLVLAVSLTLSLAVVGVAFALWSGTLSFAYSVETGHLEATFYGYEIGQCDDLYKSGGITVKNAEETSTKAEVDIRNAYPGWEGNLVLKVKNTGTIPADFTWKVYRGSTGLHITSNGTAENIPGNGGTFEIPVHVRISDTFFGPNSMGKNYSFGVEIDWVQAVGQQPR